MKHNIFKNISTFVLAAASFVMLSSCEEFGPVFTGKYDNPDPYKEYTDEDFKDSKIISISELKSMYTTGKPVVISDDLVVKGQVSTSDRRGNFYRSFYIQDETAGIEVKIGKTGLYNDYRPNQWVYIKCKDLALGAYGGMIQLGYESSDPKYETSYIDVQLIIDTHIFKGKMGDPIVPVTVTDGADITAKKYLGMLCEVKGLKYGKEVFCIVYDKNNNSTYLSNSQCGIDSWAFSETGFETYLEKNRQMIADGKTPYLANPDNFEPAYYSVSQYFTLGSTDLQVRTSGYAKFADSKLTGDDENGIPDLTSVTSNGKISLTGIMTVYNANYQFTLIDLEGVKVE